MSKNIEGLSKKILIVDDTEINFLTGRLLEKEGHNVIYAGDYSEAVRKAGFKRFRTYTSPREADGIDILLTDLELPWGTDDLKPHREKGVHPLGYGLMLSAMANGVPYIGMITNQNHHDSPIAATWDYLPMRGTIKLGATVLGIWDARGCQDSDGECDPVRFYQSGDSIITVPSTVEEPQRYDNDPSWKEIRPTKNWHEAVRRLLTPEYSRTVDRKW